MVLVRKAQRPHAAHCLGIFVVPGSLISEFMLGRFPGNAKNKSGPIWNAIGTPSHNSTQPDHLQGLRPDNGAKQTRSGEGSECKWPCRQWLPWEDAVSSFLEPQTVPERVAASLPPPG
ncbi:Transmembrane Channel-Like Protein 5 [Manis pentadactyla]|nr:Transmembrane Channel-Like Protein 5 [Manis pentadactyla]